VIESELLLEKYRVQRKLSAESNSIKEYLAKTRMTAKKVAQTYGFSMSNLGIQPISAETDLRRLKNDVILRQKSFQLPIIPRHF